MKCQYFVLVVTVVSEWGSDPSDSRACGSSILRSLPQVLILPRLPGAGIKTKQFRTIEVLVKYHLTDGKYRAIMCHEVSFPTDQGPRYFDPECCRP
jgi:hypothetical protein